VGLSLLAHALELEITDKTEFIFFSSYYKISMGHEQQYLELGQLHVIYV